MSVGLDTPPEELDKDSKQIIMTQRCALVAGVKNLSHNLNSDDVVTPD